MEKPRHVDGGPKQISWGFWSTPTRLIETLLLTGAIAGLTLSAALADTPGPAADSPEKAANIDAIVVTGSRISRRDFQSDSPIVTIDQSTLAAAGQPTLDRAIGEMPQFAAAQGMSEVGDVQGSTGFAGGQAYGDLRGLGPNRALVLMDGRRMMPSNPNGSVDLNTIPMSMIENVEVITGGASATYGSDAIAGVLNFKLRQHFSGAEVSVQHGETTMGDGATELASALLGGNFADNRGNMVLAFEYSERGVVHGADRPFFANIRQLARPPEGILPGGTFGSSPTVAAVNSVLAGYPGTTPIAGAGAYNGSLGVNTDGTIFTDLAAPNCVQNYRGLGQKGLNIGAGCTQVQVALGQFFAIQVPLTKYNVLARSTYKLNDSVSAYTQFSFMESTSRDETAGGSTGPGKELYVPLNNPFVVNNAGLQTILASRPADPNNPNALTQPLVLTKLLSASGDRIQSYKYDVYQAVAGLKGDIPIPGTDLSWDVYSSYGSTLFNNLQQNDSSKAALIAILNGTANYQGSGGNCVGFAWNPLGSNPLSPGCREYVTRENSNVNTITQKNVEGTLQGKIVSLPAGELRFAVGADYRGSNFDYHPDAGLITNDSFSYDTTVATSGTQNVREVFAELLVPVLKGLPFIEELSLDLGARRSDYDGFGGVNTWKADLNWRPVSTVSVRGGYARAIRAPSLGELFAPTVTGNLNIGSGPAAGDPCATGSSFRTGANAAQVAALCQAQGVPSALYPNYTYGVDSVHGTSGGNPNLTPETADTYSIGTVWSPHFSSDLMRKFQVSVDYYHISISNAVGSLALTDILPRCFNSDGISNPAYSANNIYCQQITREQSTGNIVLGHEGLLNLASYKTDGIDTEIDWSFGLGALGLSDSAGTFRLTSLINYTHTFDVSSLPGSPVLDFAGSIGNTEVSPEMAHPHWKANTAFGYSIGPVTTTVHWRYIAAMKHQDVVVDPASTTPGVPTYNYFDFDAHLAVIEHLELTAGLTNIADKAPPFVSGQPLTTDSATYDIIGRTYYVGFKAKF
ncbi:MAG: iron complex outerrane recepter protein [Gammaproteobacteria bacterium]|jgi:outer membrane receptor protein involved in Fe transport|nr:iron complex outerrane recepter protein [Gammaproteobacteria bacterium]